MKFSAQEEYGLRCLLQLGRLKEGESITIPEMSELEGMSQTNAAKILRTLRRARLVKSERGQHGGYSLGIRPSQVTISQILAAIGGKLYEPSFCDRHRGNRAQCVHVSGCSVRSLWSSLQLLIDSVLDRVTLEDLLNSEGAVSEKLQSFSTIAQRS